MRTDKIPTTWTPIAVRDRFPPMPLPPNVTVADLWKPLPRAIMSLDAATNDYMDGKIFKACHYSRDAVFVVIKRRMKAPKVTPRAEERMRNEIRAKLYHRVRPAA